MTRSHRIVFALSVFAFLVFPGVTPAQPHGAGWSFVAHRLEPIAIGRVDRSGAITTVVASSAFPADVFFVSATLDIDDQTYVMAIISPNRNGSVVRVDQAGRITSTIQVVSTPPRQGGGWVYDVIVDQDGGYVVVEGNALSTTGQALYRVDRSGNAAESSSKRLGVMSSNRSARRPKSRCFSASSRTSRCFAGRQRISSFRG